MEAPEGTSTRSVRWLSWLRRWALVSTPGAVVAFWAVPVGLVALVAVLPAMVTSVAYGMTNPAAGRAGGPRPQLPTRWWVSLAISIAVIGVALLGIGALSGAAVPLVLGLAALTSPPMLDAVRGRRRHPARPLASAPVDRRPLDPPSMSNADLCAAWRHTFGQLQDARTTAERARLVSLRQSLLDEMESRDSAGLNAWLASGAQAAGGPDKFLRSRPDAA